MIKSVLNQLDYSFFAEASLAIFSVVFIAITIRTLLTRREVSRRQAEIVLHDSPEDTR